MNNKLCCNDLTYLNAANSALDISHSVVNILGILKTDKITSLRDPGDLLNLTMLEINHEIVKIKESLKAKMAKNYRTLYYTSVAHDIKTPVNGIMGSH